MLQNITCFKNALKRLKNMKNYEHMPLNKMN